MLIGNLQHQDHIRDIRCLHKYCLCDIIAQLSDSETGIVLLHARQARALRAQTEANAHLNSCCSLEHDQKDLERKGPFHHV